MNRMSLQEKFQLAEKEYMNEQMEVVLYRMNMLSRDTCAMKSREALKKKDLNMFHFWANASRAFERRALDTTSTQQVKRVCEEIKEVKYA